MKPNTTPTANQVADPLTPNYPDEATARAAGWQIITAPFYRPTEDSLALSVAASLAGHIPGTVAVRFCVVGTASRIAFARRASELVGMAAEPTVAPPPADSSHMAA